MRKILMFCVLIVSINSFAQGPSGYQYRTVRERLLAFIVDSGLHVPRYNGVPSGLRSGVYIADGLISMDTLNGNFYGYRNSAWFRVANYSDLATASRFGVEDARAGQNRIFTGLNNTYSLALDSLDYFRVDRNGVTRIYQNSSTSSLYSPDGNTQANVLNNLVQLSVGSASNYLWGRVDSFLTPKRISYTHNINGSLTDYSLITKRYADSLVGAIGGAPTWQQTLTAGSTLTGNNTITMGTTTFTMNGSTNATQFEVNNSTNGNAIKGINAGNNGAIWGETTTGQSFVAIGGENAELFDGTGTQSNTSTVRTLSNWTLNSSGSVAAGFGQAHRFLLETSISSSVLAARDVISWSDHTHASRTVWRDFYGVNNAVEERYMNIQPGGVVRVNNDTDTLSTKAYARSVGGGGGGNVTKVGTPVNDQVGIWTGDGTIEGDADFTFDGTAITGRWKARVGSTTSSATPTINTDVTDIYKLTAQAADITSFTSNLSGSPNDGDVLEIQITGTAARAITWGSSFVATTVALPTTTVTTTTLTVLFQYYTTSSYGNNKWHCVNYY